MENPDPLLQIPRFQIGKTGIEAFAEEELRGEAGTLKIEVSAAGRVMRELGRVEGTPGKDMELTLDLGLQSYAMRRMAGQSASAVVIDMTNGDIVAMASAPGFDPNSFVFGIKSPEWNALLNDEYRPLSHKSVTGNYPPGSTFKMTMALAALEAGLVSPGDGVGCPGFTWLGNRRFHCWKRGGHGRVDLRRSLSQSCDCYYYEMGRRLGPDRISAMAHKLGLGVAHDLPLPGVSVGNMPDAAWKEAKRGEKWTTGDSFNYGIGQGFTLASPLQLAVYTSRIASGVALKPRLLRKVGGVEVPVEAAPALDIDPRHLNTVRGGMYAVSNEGTAYRSRIADPAMLMAGKTGTSQVRIITAAERAAGVTKNEQLPWNRRDHALFVAYAPYDSAALRDRADRRARRRRVGGGGADRARHPDVRALRRAAAARGLSGRAAQGDRGAAGGRAAGDRDRGGGRAGAGPGMSLFDAPVRGVPRGPAKLLAINWTLILLLCGVASAGFLMLYSVAGGSLEPWAGAQMMRFAAGIVDHDRGRDDRHPLLEGDGAARLRGVAGAAVAVDIMGVIGMGAQRWIDLGLVQIQPSEMMKVALVMALAAYYAWLDPAKVSRPFWVILPLLLILMPVGLVLEQPDLGTAILLLAGGGAVMFLAGVSLWYFAVAIALGRRARRAGARVARASRGSCSRTTSSAASSPSSTPSADPLGAGYHITQAKIAMGSGGLAGRGYMQGTQSRLNFLPEKHTDFIFTTLAEEFGYVGTTTVLVLYALIIVLLMLSAISNRDRFGALLTGGIAMTFFLLFAVNMGMVMGIMPVVGVPLPLVSYGGTAMVVLLGAFGLVQSAHVHRPRGQD